MQPDRINLGFDVDDRHPADRSRCLGVKQNEQTGQPVIGLEAVVVQQAARDVPAVLVIEGSGRAHPAVGADADTGQLVPMGPSDEVSRRPTMCRGGVGEPSIEVAVLTAAQRELVFGEPVQEGDGRVYALAH